MKKPFVIDLSQEDGKPHWLKKGQRNPNAQRDRQRKYRDAYLAGKKAEKDHGLKAK